MLPEKFCERMEKLLGKDYPAFLRAMTEDAPVHGVRVNGVKYSVSDFTTHAPFETTKIPYAEDGFIHTQEKIGRHPYHHAGILYSQDPGAMSALAGAPIPRGGRVLDVCAAPGGKSAQLAAGIGPDGLLVSCEYVPSRCHLLVSNIERLGIPNALVLNTDAPTLAAFYPAYFDMVVVDAPCSGEGMFRKNEEAIAEWSEENVRRSAERQREILASAAACVAPGGYLVYSTCTFAPEEDEEQVAAFLASHPDFTLAPFSDAVSRHTAPGIQPDGCPHDLTLTRRFYPHIAPGEGQFAALMRRAPGGAPGTPAYRDATDAPAKADAAVLSAFFRDNMTDDLSGRVRLLHGNLILPPDLPIPPRAVFAAGVAVGEIRKGVLFPHHQLFTTHGCRFRRKLDLALDDPRLFAYLHGDVIPAPELANGYAAVLVDGCPLGGGKVVDGVLKNLYPKGLRNMG